MAASATVGSVPYKCEQILVWLQINTAMICTGSERESHLSHSSPLPLSQAHLRPLRPHKSECLLWAHAHLPDQVADDQRGAAPTASLAVHVGELPTLRMLCTGTLLTDRTFKCGCAAIH